MATRIVETSDSRQTEALGAELAAALSPGDIVLVRGELGAGKTTLVRGAARRLGVTGPVTSPTFAIGHRYQGTQVVVSHLDLYRLSSLQEEEPELLEDYLGPGRIAFVEWPERTNVELRDARIVVTLTHQGADKRRIEMCDRSDRDDSGERDDRSEHSGRDDSSDRDDRSEHSGRDDSSDRDDRSERDKRDPAASGRRDVAELAQPERVHAEGAAR